MAEENNAAQYLRFVFVVAQEYFGYPSYDASFCCISYALVEASYRFFSQQQVIF